MFKNHKIRAEKARIFMENNKVFCVVVGILILIIIISSVGNMISKSQISTENPVAENEQKSVSELEAFEKVGEKQEPAKWRFHAIDGVILVVGGGFSTFMYLRERKKLRLDE